MPQVRVTNWAKLQLDRRSARTDVPTTKIIDQLLRDSLRSKPQTRRTEGKRGTEARLVSP